ncbi:T-complex protein 1 subunit delta [Pestalotiopsis sp. IQ-011]
MSPKDIIGAATLALLQTAPDTVATALSKAPIGVDVPAPTNILSSIVATTTTMLAAASSAAMSSSSSSAAHMAGGSESGPAGGDEGSGECRLLGSFALFIQLALGGLALLSLVYKRYRERPQRPLKIWAFDVSKQVVGSVLVHIANVFMSMLTSGRFSIKVEPMSVQTAARLLRRDDDVYVPNPCSFYLLNLAIDTTLGIPILIILLRVFTGLVSYTPLGKPAESIQSGNYGSPPKTWWWIKQSIIYFCGLFGMKICVLILFLILPWIARVGDWALGWTEGNEKLQIVFVMMLFPLIMNAMQYYIIDSFIKHSEMDHERLPQEDDDRSFDNTLAEDDEISDSEDRTRRSSSKAYKGMARKDSKTVAEEYDPEHDHEVDWNNSSHSGQGKKKGDALPKDLYPRE